MSLELINTEEAARRLALSPYTLRRMRCDGDGPAYVRLGGRNTIRYRLRDLEEWLIEAGGSR